MDWRTEPPAADSRAVRSRHESNRAAWNQGAGVYAARQAADVEFLRGGGSNLHPIERENLGDLRRFGCAIHLQCASGKDTLSLLNEGVDRVVGVDISDVHIENARRAGEALGANAEWYRCDVLDVPHDLDGTADLVYTGRGALCWIHDLDAWAAVVARLLRPGGVVSILDDHPIAWLFDPDAETLVPSGNDYFVHAEAGKGWPESYLGDAGLSEAELAELHERVWTLADVHGALHGAGLVVERLGEHREAYWNAMPNLREELRERIPQSFSMVARKPA